MKKMNACNVKIKYGNIPDKKFDKRQLAIGTRVEMEHTNSRCLAKKISKTHLHEFPNYYHFLTIAERQMAADMKKRRR